MRTSEGGQRPEDSGSAGAAATESRSAHSTGTALGVGTGSSTGTSSTARTGDRQSTQVSPGQILDGRYRIVDKLGEGGMGEVYAAEHIHIEKKVAIKLLRHEIVTNPEAVDRFRREARSASSIGHPNIIAIEDFGNLDDGRIFLCMELLEGRPWNDMLTEQLAPERTLSILIQTCHGLAAAHKKGIVHRDLKPENIFVTTTAAGAEVPKILDFGIAKVLGTDRDNKLTQTGTIFGTPFYMSPEQALGQEVDHRADIYAMGVIMYEAFTGVIPFEGESFMGILTQHITAEPVPPSKRAISNGRVLPPGVESIIDRAMKKTPDERYATMDELTAVLIGLHRDLGGPGMSSYMQPHVNEDSAGFSAVVQEFSSGPMGAMGAISTPVPTAGDAMPMAAQDSGGHRARSHSGSARTPTLANPTSSGRKLALIAALFAAVLAVGGLVMFVIIPRHSSTGKPTPRPPVVTGDHKPQKLPPVATGKQGVGPTDGQGNSQGNNHNNSQLAAGKPTSGTAVTTPGSPSVASKQDLNGQDPNGQDPNGQDPNGQDPNGQTATPGTDNGAQPTGPASPVASTPVTVLVHAEPRAAAVLDLERNVVLGSTPLNIEVNPDQPKKYLLRHPRFRAVEITLDGSTTRAVIRLEPKRRAGGKGKDKDNAADDQTATNQNGSDDQQKTTEDDRAGDLGLTLE